MADMMAETQLPAVVAQDAEETPGAVRLYDGGLQQEMRRRQHYEGGGWRWVSRWVDVPSIESEEQSG